MISHQYGSLVKAMDCKIHIQRWGECGAKRSVALQDHSAGQRVLLQDHCRVGDGRVGHEGWKGVLLGQLKPNEY